MFLMNTASKTTPYESIEEESLEEEDQRVDENYKKFWEVDDEAKTFSIRRFANPVPKGTNSSKSVTAVTFIDIPSNSGETTFKNPMIVTANDDGIAVVWDVYSREKLVTLKGHSKKLTSIASHVQYEGGRIRYIRIVTGSEDTTAIIWEMNSPYGCEIKHCLNTKANDDKVHEKTISCLSICDPKPEPPIVVLGSIDKRISVWGLNDGKLLYYIQTKHTDLLLSLTTLHISEGYKGVRIITTGWDKKIFCWSWANSVPESSLLGHTKSVTCCAAYVSPLPDTVDLKTGATIPNAQKCAIVVTGSLDNNAIVWDLASATKTATLSGHKSQLTAIRICENRMITEKKGSSNSDRSSNSAPIIITSSIDKTVILWDLISNNQIRVIEEVQKVNCLAVCSSDFRFLIVGGLSDGCAMIWNMSKTDRTWKMYTDAVTAICTYDPRPGEDKYTEPVVVIGTIDNSLSIFTLKNDEAVSAGRPETANRSMKRTSSSKRDLRYSKLPIGIFNEHKSRINAAVIYSPPCIDQPPLVASCDGVGCIIVWNLFTQVSVVKLEAAHAINVLTIALYNPYIYKPEIYTEKAKHPTICEGVDMSKPMIISGGGDKRIVLWDILESSEFEPDGSPRTANHVPVLQKQNAHKAFVRSISVYHPVPSLVNRKPYFVSASYDLTAVVWDLETFTPLQTLTGHTEYVFFNAIYDPIAHLGLPKPDETNENFLYPTVVTTSYDKTVGIWNMDKGNLKRTLIGHTESVTALALYVPKSKEEAPLVITGSIDQLIMIWNLFTGSRLQVLVGHTDRVCYIMVYAPPSNNTQLPSIGASSCTPNANAKESEEESFSSPIIISGGDDKVNIVWEDALYQKAFMPVTDAVQRAFESDCATSDWPMITNLAARYGILLLYENTHLFYLAIKNHRSDFLLKYISYLHVILRNIPQTKTQNLLTYAIAKNDLVSVRCILLSWIENLNEDIQDMLGQRLFHAMYYFPHDSLQQLVNKYPMEFLSFIKSIRLIRNHASLMSNVPLLCLDGDERYDAVGTVDPLTHYHDMWSKHAVYYFNGSEQHLKRRNAQLEQESELNHDEAAPFVNPLKSGPSVSQRFTTSSSQIVLPPKPEKPVLREVLRKLWIRWVRSLTWNNQHPQPVTSLTIPIRNIAKLDESLLLFLEVSNQLNRVDIFDSEVVIIALRYFWDNYGKGSHIFSTMKYGLLLFLFDFSLYYYEIQSPNLNWEEIYARNQNLTDSELPPSLGVTWYDDDTGGQRSNQTLSYSHTGMIIFNYIVLSYFIYYLVEECTQIKREIDYYQETTLRTMRQAHSHIDTLIPQFPVLQSMLYVIKVLFVHFLSDLWNCVDVSLVILAVSGIILRIIFDEDTPTGRSLFALASVLLWFKVLYYLRPFSSSGPLVAMILLIASNIRIFLIVLFCVLIGFMQAFWILSNVNPLLMFGTVRDAFLASFMFMLGQGISMNFAGTVSPRLATFLLVCFMLTMMILMLNLLIALMGDAFSDARAKGKALWRHEQCSIMIEQRFLLKEETIHSVPPYIHILKYTSNVSKNANQDESYTQFKELVDQSSAHVTKYTELETDISKLKEEKSSTAENADFDFFMTQMKEKYVARKAAAKGKK